MTETVHTTIFDLPDSALLLVLQRLDCSSVLRLSLSSHAAKRRLATITNLWQDLARLVLGLAAQASHSTATANAANRQHTQTHGSGDTPAPHTREAGAPSRAYSPPFQPPAAADVPVAATAAGAVATAADAERHRRTLLRFASFSRWRHHSSLRLARVSGSLPAPQHRDGAAWQVPPAGAAVLVAEVEVEVAAAAEAGRSARRSEFALTAEELYCMRACDGSDITVHGTTVRCFAAARAPSGAPAKLVVALARHGRPFAWLHYTAAPMRPGWQQQLLLRPSQPPQLRQQCCAAAAAPGKGPSSPPVLACANDASCSATGTVEAAAERAAQRGGGGAAARSASGQPGCPAALHAPEVWCRVGARVPQVTLPHGGGIDGADGISSGGCAELAALLRAFVEAGRERLRTVGVLSFVPRRRLAEAKVARDLAAMREGGVEVLDLVGVLDAEPQQLGTRGHAARAHGRARITAEPAGGTVPSEGATVNAAGRVGSVAGVHAGQGTCSSRLRELEGQLRRELRSAAESGGGGGGGGAESAALRQAVSALPRECPGLQVLVLPAVLPRSGRAVRNTPSRAGGSKLSAPRLLQLLVPVLSELRIAMAMRPAGRGGPCACGSSGSCCCGGCGDGGARGLPRLGAVVMVLEPEAEPHEAALRQLAASTLDRCTGLEGDTGGAEREGDGAGAG